MARILIVEDDEKLARYTELELTHEGYEVVKSGNGSEAFEIISKNDFDLVLLDVMLPGINGMEVLRRLHLQEQQDTDFFAPPVILLTARDAVMDKVAGLDAGAADYVTKPFAIEELLARIRVALKLHPRRTDHQTKTEENNLYAATAIQIPADSDLTAGGREQSDRTVKNSSGGAEPISTSLSHIITWHDLTMDLHKYRVSYAGDEITLTNREFLMLKCLLENRDIVMGRDTLLSKVCGYDYVGETNVVDVYIRYLRSKIDDAYKIKMIHTVRGVGYVIYE